MSQSNLQNHVAILLDVSASMENILSDAQKVMENIIEHLKQKSVTFDQETRISLYTFSNDVRCVIYNMDAMRFKNLEKFRSQSMTALADATVKALDDLDQIPQLYCDHAFMVYVITDGMENASKVNLTRFAQRIKNLQDNYTLVGFVPDTMAKDYLVNLGFPRGNIDKWEATKKGISELGNTINTSVDNYFTMRSQGVRSSDRILSDLSQVSKRQVQATLKPLTSSQYNIIQQDKELKGTVQIRTLVENKTNRNYVMGNAFYELVKTETIQANKQIAIQDNQTKKIYIGDQARAMLGLPNETVKVKPGDHGNWTVYVQSTSYNRNVIPYQHVLVLK